MNKSERRAEILKNQAFKNIKKEDLLHRGFLKPIEIALKTYKTQSIKTKKHKQPKKFIEPKQQQIIEPRKPIKPALKPGDLPRGLKIVVKQSLTSDKRTFHNVVEVDRNLPYQSLKLNNQDNILSLMKKDGGIKLAICICMYSQNKKRLKSTLSGVANNIANLVACQRMNPDQIGVFVIMDGIEKVDSSVIDYFQELERSNNINLGDEIVPPMSYQEISNKAWHLDKGDIQQLHIKNVNHYLFDIVELQERKNLRFAQVRKDYDQIKQLQSEIKKLKEGRPFFNDLPTKLRPFFFQQAKEEFKKDYALSDQDINQLQTELQKQRFEKRLYQQYALDVLKVRPLVMKTLQEGDRFCTNYFSTRQDLAYLACFRNKTKFRQFQRRRVVNNVQNIQEERALLQNSYTVMNLFMCVKYKNSGKLSSHNWFFNGFCQELRPEFAVLLDVGLKPQDTAILKMYRYLQKNKRTVQQEKQEKGGVGGVCGYMSVKMEKTETNEQIKDQDVDFLTSIVNKFVDIQRTQQVQYHFAHLLDKGFEASYGFIHVLPGAFSAYNMKAIVDYVKPVDDDLLKNYFKSIDQKLANRKVVQSELTKTNVFLRTFLPDFINSKYLKIEPESDEAMLYSENMYLAEDRILCMGIHKKGYSISYLPDAYAEVDPIKTVHGLLGQRKRWINGSYFAFEKVKQQLKEHESEKGCEFFLNLQIFYLCLMNGLSYFSPAFFLFTFHIAMQAFKTDLLPKVFNCVMNPEGSKFYNAFVFTMDFIYFLLIMTIIFLSLHLDHKHKRFIPYIYGISTLFGIFMVCVFSVLVVDILRGLINHQAYLIQNQTLIDTIPGGIVTLNVMRWLLITSVLIYILPISIYIVLFKNYHILCDIILGSLSFLFYTPTYLNILNVYSLCRIDDISWGTKGIQSVTAASHELRASWKLIKFVHVIKFVFWNLVLGMILLSLGQIKAPRFYVTILMVALIGFSISLKVLLSCFYMIIYWCKYHHIKQNPLFSFRSRIADLTQEYQSSILKEVELNLEEMQRQYIRNPEIVEPFIQRQRKEDLVKNALKKQQELQKGRSSAQGKIGQNQNQIVNQILQTIEEVSRETSQRYLQKSNQNFQRSIQKNQQKFNQQIKQKSIYNTQQNYSKQSDNDDAQTINNQKINQPKKEEESQKMDGSLERMSLSSIMKKVDKNKFKKYRNNLMSIQ